MNASMTVNAVVMAPMPQASDSTAMHVNPTLRRISRSGVAQILEQILEPSKREQVVTGFLEERRVAELPARALSGRIRLDALRRVLLLQKLEMQLKLVPELAVVSRRSGGPCPLEEPRPPAESHHPSWRIAATAPAIAFHRSVSAPTAGRRGG